jgi:hypothetical protein
VLSEIEVAGTAYLERIFGALGGAKVEEFVRVMDDFAKSADAVQRSSEFQP